MKNRTYIGYILLFLTVIVLAWSNYKPGTYLLGWDSLQTELNPILGVKRAIFSVWEEYQSVGLLAGMAHGADLVRAILIVLMSAVLPQSIVRYAFQMFMIFLGACGMFRLLLQAELEEKKPVFALLGALFYIFNFGSVQINFLPFESFSVFFAMLPWELWIFWKITGQKQIHRRDWLIFILINLLATPQNVSQQLFVVYLLILGLITFSFLFQKERLPYIKKSFIAIFLIFIINSFWILPQAYFFRNSRSVFENANINLHLTEDVYYKNLTKGNIKDFIQLKGFFEDSTGNNNQPLFAVWKNHMENPAVKVASMILILITFLGIFHKSRYRKSFLFIYGLVAVALLNDTPPFNSINSLIRGVDIINIIFRSPFTKFIIPYSLVVSFFLASGIALIYKQLLRYSFFHIKGKKIIYLLTILIIELIIIYSFPSFQGFYISPEMKVKIPRDYFNVINFLRRENANTRIAIFPDYTFWGWYQYNWGYDGSGFLWYGLEQPVISRNFDYWSGNSENYYWEITKAVYSQDLSLFENVLNKYQVNWLIVDRNMLSATTAKALYTDQLEQMIVKSNDIKFVFSSGRINLFQVFNSNYSNFLTISGNMPMISPNYKWNNFDKAHEDYGDYLSQTQNSNVNNPQPIIYYPFRSLFTGRQQSELEFTVKDDNDYWSFYAKVPADLVGSKLVIPAINKDEITEYDKNDLSKSIQKYPQIYLDNELIDTTPESDSGQARMTLEIPLTYIREGNLEVRVPKIEGYYSQYLEPSTQNPEPKTCDPFNKGIYKLERVRPSGNSRSDPDLLRLTSIGSSNCLDFDLPQLTQRIGYLISVENRNIEGKSLLFSIINKESQRADLETYLPKRVRPLGNSRSDPGVDTSYFIQPPMEDYGLGYSLHLDNLSIGRVKTMNDLGRITVNPIPYRFLTGLKIVKNQITNNKEQITNDEYKVEHPNPSLYQITVNNQQTTDNYTTLILSQSFDSGWKAYNIGIMNHESRIKNFLVNLFPFWYGEEIKDHVLVNNWENGWKLSNNIEHKTNNKEPTTIIIVYLPQYLEYIGFVLFGVGVMMVILFL